MGKPVMSDAKPEITTSLGVEIEIEIIKAFNAVLKRRRLAMYTVLEIFMRQFCDGNFKLEETDILKFSKNRNNIRMVHTMVDKKTFSRFKSFCEMKDYSVRSVLSAFFEKFSKEEYILELRSTADAEKEAEKRSCLNELMRLYELM